MFSDMLTNDIISFEQMGPGKLAFWAQLFKASLT